MNEIKGRLYLIFILNYCLALKDQPIRDTAMQQVKGRAHICILKIKETNHLKERRTNLLFMVKDTKSLAKIVDIIQIGI